WRPPKSPSALLSTSLPPCRLARCRESPGEAARRLPRTVAGLDRLCVAARPLCLITEFCGGECEPGLRVVHCRTEHQSDDSAVAADQRASRVTGSHRATKCVDLPGHLGLVVNVRPGQVDTFP